MREAEVAGEKGVGGEVSGLIRVWKSMEKSKAPPTVCFVVRVRVRFM